MADLPKSPLAPVGFPNLPIIDGVRFASASAGVKYQGRTDVMLAVLVEGTAMAGVFTKSATRSANVLDCQGKISRESSQGAAIVVNSGNSNAFTGRAGEESVKAICDTVAAVTGISANRVYTSSTGVIGERLPHDRINAKIAELNASLSEDGIREAASALMTTDNFRKGAGAEIIVDGQPVRIAGIAKGSGMIAPDMATMLVYIFTDAKVSRDDL
ncbi:MAG: bifunctional ornithine acetyltransferase/N-acetylglutamate synthase, partial [Paracoccaceae bacterium]|nr:bifunctional ornithine acetyltransferase/N-acetylglutamate synthase [Paracoccaceae bacterium]